MHSFISKEIKETFLNNNFFINCGMEKDLEYSFDFVFEPNREKAIASLNHEKWENFIFERFQDVVGLKTVDFKIWNVSAKEVRKEIVPKIVENIKNNNHDKEMLKAISDQFKFDIVVCIVGDRFKESAKPEIELFEQICEIYLSGHIPCGWKGTKKRGKIIVH